MTEAKSGQQVDLLLKCLMMMMMISVNSFTEFATSYTFADETGSFDFNRR
jgi:hypothetical protein